MCDLCDEYYNHSQIVSFMRNNNVPEDILVCEEGWREVSRMWGIHGGAQKIISIDEWTAVCRSRGHLT